MEKNEKYAYILFVNLDDTINKILYFEDNDSESQKGAIRFLTNIGSDLKVEFYKRSTIWDKIIRCWTSQDRNGNFMAPLVSSLKYYKRLIVIRRGLPRIIDKLLLSSLFSYGLIRYYIDGSRYYRRNLLSDIMNRLEKYHAQLKRDNNILFEEQQLMQDLYYDQKKILNFMENLFLGLSERKTSTAFSKAKLDFIENELLYLLQVNQEQLRLQNQITEYGIQELKLIQSKNQLILQEVRENLLLPLETLKASTS